MCTLDGLCKGYKAFQEKVFPVHQDHFEGLASSQSPDVVFLTCSDSRVNPNLFTSTRPGELFVLRNAGNIMPAADAHSKGEQASLEFAVTALNSPHIVVCGHSDCGAVKAMRDAPDLSSAFALGSWLQESGCASEINAKKDMPLEDLVKLNVVQQLKNLESLPFVKERLDQNKIQLHGWYYDIGAGRVDCYDAEQGCWGCLHEVLEKAKKVA